MIRVVIGGATGWTGEPLARAIRAADDLEIVAAVSRTRDGMDLGVALGEEPWGVPVFGSVAEVLNAASTGTLAGVDVYVDYTSHAAVRAHVLTALAHGVHVVVGSSGLTGADYADVAAAATAADVGVIAAGNFALTAALAQAAAVMVARHLPQWEVIDFASATKPDVPSGTARELAERLSAVHRPSIGVPVDDIAGPREARGADVDGTRVHSVRLPGYVVSTEVIFGLEGQRLRISFDAGDSPQPYVDGTLLAVRRVRGVRGLVRGLDQLL